jgi:hypothetical protein
MKFKLNAKQLIKIARSQEVEKFNALKFPEKSFGCEQNFVSVKLGFFWARIQKQIFMLYSDFWEICN